MGRLARASGAQWPSSCCENRRECKPRASMLMPEAFEISDEYSRNRKQRSSVMRIVADGRQSAPEALDKK